MRQSLITLALTSALIPASSIAAGKVTLEDLYNLIQQQQAEINALKKQVSDNNSKIESTDQKVEVTASAVEKVASGGTGTAWSNKTHLEGYGELHYNALDGKGGNNDLDQLDLHRFIIEVEHEFTDQLRVVGEVEIEHALTVDTADGSGPGEVEVEQAYIEYDGSEAWSARGGVFLLPVGILNETHEPNTFYGVERNPVENHIIPATWWEGGVGGTWRAENGLQFDAAFHSGLNSATGDIRGGRQKVAKATAESGAFTGRVKYTGITGLELAAAFNYQADMSQGTAASDVEGTLWETHAIYQNNGFGLRALYAMWDIDGLAAGAANAEQEGWYIEPSYKFNENVGVFARFHQWDEDAGDSTASEQEQWNIGVNWWPHPDVVIKADYEDTDFDAGSVGTERKGVNIGIGYSF